MKKIKIKNIQRADKESIYLKNKLHRVYLGNGKTELFSNQKDARIYLGNANWFLNFKLAELNQVYIETFREYRNIWFYLNGNSEYISIERTVTNFFSQIDQAFDLCYQRSHFENGNHFVFTWLSNICNCIISICDQVKTVHSQRMNYSEQTRMESIRQRIFYVLKCLNDYGTTPVEKQVLEENIDYPQLKIASK